MLSSWNFQYYTRTKIFLMKTLLVIIINISVYKGQGTLKNNSSYTIFYKFNEKRIKEVKILFLCTLLNLEHQTTNIFLSH